MIKQDLYNMLIEVISSNKELSEYCQEIFGRKFTLVLGYHEEAPPQKEDYPCIVIAQLSRGSLYKRESKFAKMVAGLHVLISYDGIREEENNGIVTRTQEGLIIIEKMAEYLITGIVKQPSPYIINAHFETELNNFYPVYQENIVVEFSLYSAQKGGRRI